ncbi:MAG: type II secretion system protein GspM [Usitatibacteraceae bacterium]
MSTASVPTWLPADPQKRRWLALALFVLLSALIIAAIAVPAVMLHRHYDASIAKLSRQVSTQTAFNALRPRLTEKLEALKGRDVKKYFLKGTSSALALAELQETVRTTIEANGGRVVGSSVPGNAPKDEGPYRQVATAFTMNTNNPNLRRVLYALESREPYLYIDTIMVQPQVGTGYKPVPGAAEPDMYIQLEVHAFALRAPSEAAPVSPEKGAAPAAAKGSAT